MPRDLLKWLMPVGVGLGLALVELIGLEPALVPALLVCLLGGLLFVRHPDWALYLLIFALPLNTVALPIKGLRLKLCQGVLLLAIGVWGLRAMVRQQAVRLPGILIPFGVFIACLAGASVAGVSWRAPALLMQWTLFLVTVVALCNFIEDRAVLWRVVGVHIGTGALMAFYDIVQSVTSHAGLKLFDLYQTGRAQGFFPEPDWFGYYLLSVFFPLLSLMAADAWPKARSWLQAAFALVVIALLLSQVRAAWVGAAVGLVGFAAWNPKLAFGLAKRTWLPALGGTIALVLLILANPDVGEAFSKRLDGFADPNETANMYRLYMMEATMDMIWENPFFGYGLGSWGPLVGLTGPNAVGTWNIFMSSWFDSGLIGLSAELWLFGHVGVMLKRAMNRTDDPALATLFQGWLLGFVAMVVCNQFSDGSYFDFFWAYIGLAAAAAHLAVPVAAAVGKGAQREGLSRHRQLEHGRAPAALPLLPDPGAGRRVGDVGGG